MVKSYQRYELERTFGVISSNSNALWLPGGSKSGGKAITAGVEQVLVWDIKTGELLQRLHDGAKVGASNAATSTAPAEVVTLAFEPSSQLIAAGCDDGAIKIWDMSSGSVIMVFNGHRSAVTQLQFDKSGTRLCSGSRDSSIILWDLVGETGLFKLQGHRDQVNGLTFLSNDENKVVDDLEDYLVSTSKDGLIKLWDLKSQQCIETHVAHSGESWAMGVDPTKQFLITSGMENQIKVWRIDLEQKTRKLIELGFYEKQSKARGSEISFCTVSSNAFFFVQNADRTVEVFRLRTPDEIAKAKTKRTKRLKEKGMDDDEIAESLSGGLINMLICPFTIIRAPSKLRSCTWTVTNKNKLDILLALNNNSLEYHTISMPESIRKHNVQTPISSKKYMITLAGHRNDIRSVDISDDNKLIATSSNGQLKIWNTKTTNCIRSFDCGYSLVSRFLPGGALVILGTKEGELELYDLASSTLLHSESEAHAGAIWSIEISADGKSFITGSADKNVKFWDIKVDQEAHVSFEHKRTLELNEDVLCVRLTPDNKLLAVSLLDNTVKVFFQDTLKFFLSLYGHKLPVLSIDISFDSKLIITSSADKNIRIWGLDFGDCHKSIFGHQDSIMCVRFLPESKNFFSCSKDGMVKYWDGIKFECIQKLAAHHSEVWSLAVSSDGDFMCSVSHDKSIRVWYQSDDEVFIEEEKEKEMDELYEDKLLQSLEGDEPVKKNDDEEVEDEVTRASRQTMETLKAGEKLMEALDLGSKEYDEFEQYERELKAFKLGKIKTMPDTPTRNPILAALNQKPEVYILDVLLKIRPAQLDDSLVVLPFSYTLKLLKFIQVWTNDDNINRNITSLSSICRVLFFIVRSNAMELINQKDEDLKRQILSLKEQLRKQLSKSTNEIGFNVAGLKYMKTQWNLNHSVQFVDEFKQAQVDEDKSRKRVYTTLT
ncbi:unnamed protein product [Kuraishia capsulata CBS 1993]|uniref:Small-subunit processome Utp12 domain-containing protein n=1 Tax=Kuraishia capsulata CBS 1993 TaxID=1382522 RepID=W6MFA9_9ASCO|nr:uncharacterized protein KUCA_T00000136001 [Kuraishia capsulata CBS 1993]CDK24176.1 unnamed protein product [Kuraishia capsulata CBS 1993]